MQIMNRELLLRGRVDPNQGRPSAARHRPWHDELDFRIAMDQWPLCASCPYLSCAEFCCHYLVPISLLCVSVWKTECRSFEFTKLWVRDRSIHTVYFTSGLDVDHENPVFKLTVVTWWVCRGCLIREGACSTYGEGWTIGTEAWML